MSLVRGRGNIPAIPWNNVPLEKYFVWWLHRSFVDHLVKMFILVDFGGPFYHLLFTAFCANKNYNHCQCLLVLMSKLYINFFCSPRCGCWPGSGRRLNSGGHGLRHPVQTRHLWWSNQVKQGVVIFMENNFPSRGILILTSPRWESETLDVLGPRMENRSNY